jgi:hypothetical protein
MRLWRAKLIATPEANAAHDDLMQLATLDEPLSKSTGVACKLLTPGF